VEGMPQRAERLRGRQGEGGVERLFGIGARFPLVADRELACDGRTLSNGRPHPANPRKRGREMWPYPMPQVFTAPVGIVTGWSSRPDSE
jgi:hypothetical protein